MNERTNERISELSKATQQVNGKATADPTASNLLLGHHSLDYTAFPNMRGHLRRVQT